MFSVIKLEYAEKKHEESILFCFLLQEMCLLLKAHYITVLKSSQIEEN